MFESYEDLIEQSVDLNHRGIPFMTTLVKIVNGMDPIPQPFTTDLQEYVKELIAFMTMIELKANEEGDLFTNDFADRTIH